jgi:murein L,D-transpeptidase YafK
MKKTIKVLLLLLFCSFLGVFIYNVLPVEKLTDYIGIDRILVLKSKRQLIVFSKGKALKTYKIALGTHPTGPKQCEGDRKTPEGIYIINDKNPCSRFHKNLAISYPNADDINNAKQTGKLTGGDIKIHGLQNGLGFIGKLQRLSDWTAGCIALTNSDVDELYAHTPIGTPIEIRP